MDNIFDIIKNLSYNKEQLDCDVINKMYEPFVVNRALSNTRDTLFFANEMNARSLLPKDMQYGFYFHVLQRKKRFGKWNKPKEDKEVIELIKLCYNVSYYRAIELYPLLSDKVDIMKDYVLKGGI